MDPISALALTKSVQGVTETVQKLAGQGKETDKKSESSGSDFDSFLRGIISPDSANNTNEEELFAGLIQERLNKHVGTEAAEAYAAKLAEMKTKNTRADGYVFVEKSAEEALSALATDGTITTEQADQIKSEAFTAAQLDDNTAELYDGRGGPNDPTIAVLGMEAALLKAREMLGKIESGEVTAEAGENKAVGDTSQIANENIPTGTTFDGAEGFLFKPESEKDKKLVVLLPAMLTEEIDKVLLRDSAGNEVETGNFTSVANGGREHYRFSKSGGEYPADLTVEVVMKDGSTKTFKIPDPSQRYD